MTNTKFRKRALLSSVAMLLVALVALGSATFAWFVANPSVTASGLVMKTSASTGLLVKSESVNAISGTPFAKETKLDAAGLAEGVAAADADTVAEFTAHASRDLQPVTFEGTNSGTFAATFDDSNALVFKDIVAAKSSESTKKSDGTWNTQTAQTPSVGTGYYYKENIYVRTSAGSTGTATVAKANVTITLGNSSDTIKNAVRVALVANQYDSTNQTTTSTLVGVWAPADAMDAAGKKKNDSGFAFKTGSGNVDATSVFKASAADATTSLVVDGTNNNYFTAYVYIDGYDFQSYSDNVTTSTDAILSNVSIVFTKAA